MRFKWNLLLNEDRRRETEKRPEDQRNEFERDYDRVVFSSAFRRLQDKAQVFPLEKDDYVRTRLTHSLEVSTIGRSLAADVARTLKAKYGNDDMIKENREISVTAILSTTCLLHDIGNPPFGHFGEEAIRSWFKEKWNKKYLNGLKEKEKHDFYNFEGNAQTLRILTYLQHHKDDKGLNLTYGTLGAMIKYTCDSENINEKKGKSSAKCGYYQSEKKIFDEIQAKTGLKGKRHPLVYLMEAADDIAYLAIDIQDALKKEVVPFELFVEFMNDNLEKDQNKDIITKFINTANSFKDAWGYHRAYNIATQQFRIDVAGIMFRSCVDSFCRNYDLIMEGKFKETLINVSDSVNLKNTLRDFAKKQIYTLRPVLAMEVIGCEVIHSLLNVFVPSILSPKCWDSRTYEGKVYLLISPVLRKLLENYGNKMSKYQKIMLITDYISGMTDSFALNLYQKLFGIKLRH